MQCDPIQRVVMQIVARQFDVDEGSLKLATTFDQDLGADSLDTVELVMAIEQQLGAEAEIPVQQIGRLRSVQDLVDLTALHLRSA